ncbi:MAG: extensin family protein [Kofleriaceae bacterium]
MTRLGSLTLALVFALGTTAAQAAPSGKRSSKSSKRHKRRGGNKFERRIARPADGMQSPAYRYGLMTRDECEAELVTRGVPFERETEDWRGVRAPVRMTGPLHGVTYRTQLSEDERATTKWEVADCRLVLALDDFAKLLETHDCTQVIHYSMYRPPEKSHPEGTDGIRHAGALALDAGRFVTKDGKVLDVDQHWNGRRGAQTCGKDAGPRPSTADARKLRAILCEAVDARIFNSYLTPNYNRGHKNHFHLEVTAGWKSFLVF